MPAPARLVAGQEVAAAAPQLPSLCLTKTRTCADANALPPAFGRATVRVFFGTAKVCVTVFARVSYVASVQVVVGMVPTTWVITHVETFMIAPAPSETVGALAVRVACESV